MSVLDAAIRRAGSHDWVVPIPMPVAVSIVLGDDGEPAVGNVIPRGMPALDSIGPITCRACGASDFTFDCPGQVMCRTGMDGGRCFYDLAPCAGGACEFPRP
jgi:hypothetical protein